MALVCPCLFFSELSPVCTVYAERQRVLRERERDAALECMSLHSIMCQAAMSRVEPDLAHPEHWCHPCHPKEHTSALGVSQCCGQPFFSALGRTASVM